MNGRAAATCRLKEQFQMDASEKQNNDSLAGAPKVRSSKPAASKPAAKSIARANKPNTGDSVAKPQLHGRVPRQRRSWRCCSVLVVLPLGSQVKTGQ
jgi:hypothetical protein